MPETIPTPATSTPTPQTPPPATGRDAKGQYTFGNAGGPGNPFARQTAALRKAIVDSVTALDIKAVAGKLLDMAKSGDLAAAKLLFSYAIGKPKPVVEPDNLDVEEWNYFRTTSWPAIRQLLQGMGPGPELPLKLARASRPGYINDWSNKLGKAICNPSKLQKRMAELVPNDAGDISVLSRSTNGFNRTKTPSTNGSKRPSANGQPVPV